ncbi:MAG: translational GTPase TypA, partial [Elusimicrobia bacterium]|nr:translational GTPase TypA [Elusimicrobiota bacterium]
MTASCGRRQDLRNIAIIAHVDHGKTTLVDAMLKQTGAFTVKADQAQEQVLDSNELERERGITILAKNTSVTYRGTVVNIVDTPGHADFGSEVERILKMVDGALLLVDAAEGPMPQTRFVLRKALALGLHPIVVVNKMDRPQAKPHETLDRVFNLFIDLGATEPQLDFPVIYASGREGWASAAADERGADITPLLEAVLKTVPGPVVDPARTLQMLVTMLDYNNYVGRIGVGRIVNGRMAKGETVALVKPDGRVLPGRVVRLERFFGLERREVAEAGAGDIVALAGLSDIHVGDTVACAEAPQALPPLEIDEPTLSMEIMVNNSPFAGREGKFVTGRHLRERLLREVEINVGLRVEALEGEGHFKISGRGELHLSVLIETMRREGYELAVARPEVIFKDSENGPQEPMEYLIVDIPTEFQGPVIEIIGRRSARMVDMAPEGAGRLRLEYDIPSRALMGFKSELLTATRGLGLMHHAFHGYGPKGPEPAARGRGVFVAKERGATTGYALCNLQEQAAMFHGPGVEVYEGMLVGLNKAENDIVVNP